MSQDKNRHSTSITIQSQDNTLKQKMSCSIYNPYKYTSLAYLYTEAPSNLSHRNAGVERVSDQRTDTCQLSIACGCRLSRSSSIGDRREEAEGTAQQQMAPRRRGLQIVGLYPSQRICGSCLYSNRSFRWSPGELLPNIPNAHLLMDAIRIAFQNAYDCFSPVCYVSTLIVCIT